MLLGENEGVFALDAQLMTDYPLSTCPADPGERVHDGFFYRSDVGLALFEATASDTGSLPHRSSIRGIGQSAAVSVGETPVRGLVVGLNLWTASLSPIFVENGRTIKPDDDSVKLTILRVGPFLDWYPNPRRGFHVLGAVAWAVQIEHDTKGNPIKPFAMGVSLTTGTGYEWFVSSQLSLGFLGRVDSGWLTRSPGDRAENTLFVSPTIALAGTYH